MYRVLKAFNLSDDGIKTWRVDVDEIVTPRAELVPGLLAEGFIQLQKRKAPQNKRKRQQSPETKADVTRPGLVAKFS